MLAFLFLVALAVGTQANYYDFNVDTLSTEFIIGFPERAVGPDSLFLLLTAKENVIVEVSSGDPLILPPTLFSVFAFQTTIVPLPDLIEVEVNNTIENKGILVRSFFPTNVPFSLIGFNEEELDEPDDTQSSAGGFLGIPTEALGKVYRALSYTAANSLDRLSEILVVATRDNTVIQITTPVTVPGFPALTPVSITLNKLQTFQVQANNFLDLTGTLIIANKNIAVFSGGNCLEIPFPVDGCDHLVEMLPPIENYGTKFFVAPLQGRIAGDVIRVVATQDSTQVHVNGILVATLQAFQFFEFVLSSFAGAYITTNYPVVVGQYSQGRDADEGRNLDPLEIYIPHKDQYLSKYLFSVPEGYTSFLNVVVKDEAADNLKLNGEPFLGVFQPIGDTHYVFSQVPITDGAHFLEGKYPFLAYVYGATEQEFNDTNVGAYGYPCGMALVGPVSKTETGTRTQTATQTVSRSSHQTSAQTQESKTAQTSQSHAQSSSQARTTQETSNTRATQTKSRTAAPVGEGTESNSVISSTTKLLPLSILTAIVGFVLMN